MGREIWDKTLSLYFEDKTPEEIADIEKKAQILGYTRMVRRSIRRGGLDDPEESKVIDFGIREITRLVSETDSLTWD